MATSSEQLPSNVIIVTPEGKPTQPLVFYLQSLQKTADTGSTDVTALQNELDDTQTGAGLNSGGNYITPSTTQYIDSATSIYNSTLLLDTAIYTYTRELITSVSANTALSENSQTVLVDSTSGEITITLPNPANMFASGRSKVIGVTKIDTSSNKVIIQPFASETIVGEASQSLSFDGEVLNFITNGTNWYLKA